MPERKLLIFLTSTLIVAVTVALLISYIKNQQTIIGYQLGVLKNKETTLLRTRSQLKMELAKLSSKESLLKLALVKD